MIIRAIDSVATLSRTLRVRVSRYVVVCYSSVLDVAALVVWERRIAIGVIVVWFWVL